MSYEIIKVTSKTPMTVRLYVRHDMTTGYVEYKTLEYRAKGCILEFKDVDGEDIQTTLPYIIER